MNEEFLKLAVENAKKSVEMGGFPAGALIVKDGKVISEGISIGFALHDPTSHAETAAIREACKILKTSNLEGATLYESVECCNMCFSVAYWSGIERIVFAAKKTDEMIEKGYYEGKIGNETLNKSNNRKIKLIHIEELEEESINVISDWESKGGFNI